MHRAVDELVVNLGGATHVDPVAVGTLLAAGQTAADMGVTFRVHNLDRHLDRNVL